MFRKKEKEEKQEVTLPMVSTDFISGKTLETIGFVYGTDLDISLINEGDIETAIKMMTLRAVKMGADAIIDVSFSNSRTQACVSGTAVKFV